MNYCNQLWKEKAEAGAFLDDLWGVHFASMCEDVYNVALQRKFANHTEAEQRAWTNVNYLSKTDDFRGIMDAAVDALEARHQPAA